MYSIKRLLLPGLITSVCIFVASAPTELFLNFAEEETHKVDLSSLSNKLLPGLTTLGFKDDRRHKGTPTCACLLCCSIHTKSTSSSIGITKNCFLFFVR